MKYLFGDFETSDSHVNSLCLLEGAFILVDENFNELDRLEVKCRLRPTTIPSIGALLTNNVSVEMLSGANLSHFEAVMMIQKKLKQWEPFVFIGHNIINFDLEVWIRQCYKNLIPDVYQLKKLPNKVMDTLNLARASKIVNENGLKCEVSEKNSYLFKLESLCEQNNITHVNKHTALGDVMSNVKLGQLIKEKTPVVWESGLMTSHKSEADKLINNNLLISHVAYFYGRARLYLLTHVFDHPAYPGWKICFDLRADPLPLFDLGYGELQNAMSKAPKFFRTLKTNKSEILLDHSYAIKDSAYAGFNPEVYIERAKAVKNNQNFKELAARIIADEAGQKRDNIQPQLLPEERLYADGFASPKDANIMNLFHEKKDWSDKIKLAESFEDEKYSFFLKVLAYEEAPDKMPKSMYNEIHREFARRLNSMSGDEKWMTFNRFYSELDHYREKFDREGNKEKLDLLDKYDKFVIGIQKKFEVA